MYRHLRKIKRVFLSEKIKRVDCFKMFIYKIAPLKNICIIRCFYHKTSLLKLQEITHLPLIKQWLIVKELKAFFGSLCVCVF